MPLPLRESQLVTELADVLHDFLPGKPHPYANADISFPGAARAARVSAPWPAGGKRSALVALLATTLESERGRLCPLIVEVVRRAMVYQGSKKPFTREVVERVNAILADLQFKVPELHAASFLDSLPRAPMPAPTATPPTPPTGPAPATLGRLVQDLVALEGMAPVPRGTAFERFLNDLFGEYGLAPRGSFSLRGEQIDGSFSLGEDVYLVEAKWKGERTGNRDLAAFNDQVGSRTTWARGLFVSYAGFTDEGLEAFARGRSTRIICMDGIDLYHVLNGALDLREVLRAKARRAVEETRAFVPITTLFPEVTLR